MFPELARSSARFGRAVLVATARREGGRTDLRVLRLSRFFATPARRPTRQLLDQICDESAARMIGGFGHRDRLRIAKAIWNGADTHGALAEEVGIKTGPLYHHLRSLERAGLVDLGARNCYRLTEAGETILLALAALTRDDARAHKKRRRAG
jgi:DNA-binding HxlR family transcriptional regulator